MKGRCCGSPGMANSRPDPRSSTRARRDMSPTPRSRADLHARRVLAPTQARIDRCLAGLRVLRRRVQAVRRMFDDGLIDKAGARARLEAIAAKHREIAARLEAVHATREAAITLIAARAAWLERRLKAGDEISDDLE